MRKIEHSISCVIPVYNEKALLSEALNRCLNSLQVQFVDFEVILLDDGSSDGTGAMADELSATLGGGHVLVMHNGINLNLGISIQRGFASATKEYVVFDSIDLPLMPEDFGGLLADMGDADLLVIEREQYPGATVWRKITSFVNRMLLHMLFPVLTRNVSDLNYTLMFRKSIWDRIQPLAKSPAFTQPEIILRALQKGLKVKATRAAYHARTVGKGSLGRPHDIIWSMYDMVRFRILTLRMS